MFISEITINIVSIKKYKNIGFWNIVIFLKKKAIKGKYLNVLG